MFRSTVPVDTGLLVLAIVAGLAVLGAAVVVGLRHRPEPVPTGPVLRVRNAVLPWLGAAFALLLALRGAFVAAGVVGLATLAFAVVVRGRR